MCLLCSFIVFRVDTNVTYLSLRNAMSPFSNDDKNFNRVSLAHFDRDGRLISCDNCVGASVLLYLFKKFRTALV